MTKDELDSRDIFGAFQDFVTVKEAKQKEILPKSYWNCVPETCECGAEMLISRNLVHVMCCNPRCFIKLGYNLEKVYRSFGVTGIGPSTCLTLSKTCLSSTEHNSHIEFLTYEYLDLPYDLQGVKGQLIIQANQKIRTEVMPFATAVSRLGIPRWGGDAVKYLSQYDSCEQMMADVEECGSWRAFFSSKLYIQDAMKRFYLREYSRDILLAYMNVFEGFSLKPLHDVPITLSGSLCVNGIRVTKAQYLDVLNRMVPVRNGRRVLQFVNNSAVASNQYIVSDEMHSKARVAKQREQMTGKKILYGSTEFLEFVKKTFESAGDTKV